MSVDLRAIERRLKPEKRTAQLQRRSDDALPFANADLVPIGTRVLLDTCVYIDAAADRLPDGIAALLPRRFHHHSGVCLAELTAALGELDPTDRRTPGNRATIEAIIARIADDERMVVPDDHEWAMAGMLAGMLKRTQRYATEQRRKALADCLLFVSALRGGLILLTANLAEFDLLHQIFPEARIAFYRAERGAEFE
jgi:predicted nucleic acid-binding protein